MKNNKKRTLLSTLCLVMSLMIGMASKSLAVEDMSAFMHAHLDAAAHKQGESTYRKFAFSVYHISLWVAGDAWDKQKPYALELHYLRSVSKDTIVDTVIDNIHDENVADDATLASWKKMLASKIPDVGDGDRLIGISIPGKDTQLFFNGAQIASIQDKKFSDAFFNIWLGQSADEDTRRNLLASK